MFKILMRGGEYQSDTLFRDILVETLTSRSEGYIQNNFDNCLLKLEDVYAYEDENGDMIEVNPPIIP